MVFLNLLKYILPMQKNNDLLNITRFGALIKLGLDPTQNFVSRIGVRFSELRFDDLFPFFPHIDYLPINISLHESHVLPLRLSLLSV